MTYAWLHAAVESGAEIVTATNRLARELRGEYDRNVAASGRLAWPTAPVMAWSSWLKVLLERSSRPKALPLRLDTPASALLWERILREQAGDRLLNAAGLVRQMQLTWQRLQDWRVASGELHAAADSEDQRLFAAVAAAYEEELAARGWIDNAQLPACVTHLLRVRHIDVPKRLVHAGFDRLSPAARELFAVVADAGCDVQPAPPAERRTRLDLVAASDADAELRAAGAWARQHLEAEPDARIAIVYPSLERDAARIARLVREGFVPGWQYDDSLRNAVNVSYGRRLSDYPLVAVALLWLKWIHRDLESREIGILLRSPFSRQPQDDSNARLDTRLRRLPDRFWSAADVASALAGKDDAGNESVWFDCLQQIVTIRAAATGRASPAAWTDQIDGFLQRLGWPARNPPDSAEFQLVNRWRELLNDFSRLETVRPQLTLAEALLRLSLMASDVIYQPESASGVLQVLGPLEAAGLEFEHIWVANLESMQWPPVSAPLPLVSRRLQRKWGMPDAQPADTLEYARRILDRLSGSAASVVLSWPVADGDAELLPSSLLDAWRERLPAESADPGWFAAQLCGEDRLLREPHDPAPPALPGERIAGGAYTVQRQLNEPLSAFAYGRLGIRDMPLLETGLSASLRGRIIHQALAELLAGKPSLADLRAWSTGELVQRVDRSVGKATGAHARHADAVLQRLLTLERSRLNLLLLRFVAEELLRPDFTIEDVETSIRLERHGVVLELRVDRIDRLADNSLVVVDYKTGAAKNLLDATGNPVEWQLVVYALALNQDISGLVLINIDSRAIAYKGTGADVPWSPLGNEIWRDRLRAWKGTVDDAIATLAAGDVRVRIALPIQESRPLNLLSRVEVQKRDR